jgi:hypothetical protein
MRNTDGHHSGSEHDGTRSLQFSMGAAFAITACAFCSALNIAARAPIAPLFVLGIIGSTLCIVALAIRAWTPAYRWVPRFAGSLFGLALSVGAAVISQSNDLTPSMELPPPYSAFSEISAEILYGKSHPVRPLQIQPRPRSFLSRTHETATIIPPASLEAGRQSHDDGQWPGQKGEHGHAGH